MTINLRYDEKVAILDLGDDENRFSPVFLDDIDSALNDVIYGYLGSRGTRGV